MHIRRGNKAGILGKNVLVAVFSALELRNEGNVTNMISLDSMQILLIQH